MRGQVQALQKWSEQGTTDTIHVYEFACAAAVCIPLSVFGGYAKRQVGWTKLLQSPTVAEPKTGLRPRVRDGIRKALWTEIIEQAARYEQLREQKMWPLMTPFDKDLRDSVDASRGPALLTVALPSDIVKEAQAIMRSLEFKPVKNGQQVCESECKSKKHLKDIRSLLVPVLEACFEEHLDPFLEPSGDKARKYEAIFARRITAKTSDNNQRRNAFASHENNCTAGKNNFTWTAIFMVEEINPYFYDPPTSKVTLKRVGDTGTRGDATGEDGEAYVASLGHGMAYSLPGSAIAHRTEAPPPGWTLHSLTIVVATKTAKFNKTMQENFRRAIARTTTEAAGQCRHNAITL